MTKEQKERCLAAMTAYLKAQRAGFNTTSRKLLRLACGEEARAFEGDILELDAALGSYARKEGLFLAREYCRGETVGMPQDIRFSVYRKKPGARCPFCASRDTAEILYGFPAGENVLEDEEEHRLYIGGCCICDPVRHCFGCGKDFGRAVDPGSVASVLFTLYPGRCMMREARLIREDGACFCLCPDGTRQPLEQRRWAYVIRALFARLGVEQWEAERTDRIVMDGAHWELAVAFGDGSEFRLEGDEAEYPGTKELCRLFRSYLS